LPAFLSVFWGIGVGFGLCWVVGDLLCNAVHNACNAMQYASGLPLVGKDNATNKQGQGKHTQGTSNCKGLVAQTTGKGEH